jgi:PPOX class probable F420-dependent enzyme
VPSSFTDAQRAFIRENPFVAVAATVRPDGSPHSTVVWIDEEDGKIIFNTAAGRAKERHLAQDPRVTITVVDPADPYKWVSVSGTATLETEGAREHIDKLSNKYMGKDYPWYQGEQRVLVSITPELVDSYGFDG